MPGASVGLKPGVENERELQPSEADVLDLDAEGYVHQLPTTSSSVVAKFQLSARGRAAGQPRAATGTAMPGTPPPSLDAMLRWVADLEEFATGSATLAAGGEVMNAAQSAFGQEHAEAIARRLLDLRDSGLVNFNDPAASLEQLSEADRLEMASDFRVTVTGRDRVQPRTAPATTIMQVVQAAQAQVAAGNITNYVSFTQLLDRVEEALGQVDGVDDETRAEARGLLDKLRAASGTVATESASGAGGALLGALLKQALGLP